VSTLIVVGLDGSPRQEHVLAAALDLAKRKNGKLLLVRAVSIPVEVPAAAFSVEPDAVGAILLENARKDIEQLAAPIPANLRDGNHVVLGTPWHTLCDVAHERNAGLIVVGSHGYHGLDRLLGTTAAKVVNHAHCSVLVVR
jgi:nucleotide-binding universal stress UspA family protein